MTAMTDSTLPEGGEWATGSLLDKSNVGKYVHVRSSGYERVAAIAKVGRTNVHISTNYGRTVSYRVRPDELGWASGEFNSGVQTHEYQSERTERSLLAQSIREQDRVGWQRVSIDKLRRIVAILDEPVA